MLRRVVCEFGEEELLGPIVLPVCYERICFSFSFSLGPIPASSVSQPRLYLTLSTSSTSIWPDDEHFDGL